MRHGEVSVRASDPGIAATDSLSASIASVPVPAVIDVPAISGSGKIGSMQSGIPATWAIPPDQVESCWTLNGSVISGAKSASYSPVAADDRLKLRYHQRARKTNGAWSAWTHSSPVTVTYPTPVAVGKLTPRTFTEKTGVKTFDASIGFAGQALVYSLISPPAGVGIALSTGTVSVYTGGTGILPNTVVRVRATNSGGFVEQTFELAVVAALTAPVNSIAPAIGGSFVVGQTLIVSNGTWTPVSDAYTYQWTRAGADIPGAIAAGYTATLGDEGQSLGCRVVAANAAGTSVPVQATGAQKVIHVAPAASGALPSKSLSAGTGLHSFGVAGGFTGQDLSYWLVLPPPGVSIDARTGLVSIDTGATGILSDVKVAVRATNSGGQAASAMGLSVTQGWAVSGGAATLTIHSAPAVAPPVAAGGINLITVMS